MRNGNALSDLNDDDFFSGGPCPSCRLAINKETGRLKWCMGGNDIWRFRVRLMLLIPAVLLPITIIFIALSRSQITSKIHAHPRPNLMNSISKHEEYSAVEEGYVLPIARTNAIRGNEGEITKGGEMHRENLKIEGEEEEEEEEREKEKKIGKIRESVGKRVEEGKRKGEGAEYERESGKREEGIEGEEEKILPKRKTIYVSNENTILPILSQRHKRDLDGVLYLEANSKKLPHSTTL